MQPIPPIGPSDSWPLRFVARQDHIGYLICGWCDKPLWLLWDAVAALPFRTSDLTGAVTDHKGTCPRTVRQGPTAPIVETASGPGG